MYKQMDLTEYLYGISMSDADFLMNEHHQIEYNEVCASCSRKCKQSFRCTIVQCPHYRASRSSRKK